MTDKQIVQYLATHSFKHKIGKQGLTQHKVMITFYVGKNESTVEEFRKAVRVEKKFFGKLK